VIDDVDICGLEIYDAQKGDSGTYVCTGTNYHGTAQSNIRVNVVDAATAYNLRRKRTKKQQHGMSIVSQEEFMTSTKANRM
jgi:hypothetical protein